MQVILQALWYDPTNVSDTVELSLDSHFAEMGTVTMRSTWDTKAIFAGLHGGANNASHGDLDIGNFILDADGHRYFIELGQDSYSLPDYSAGKRWTYYRKRAEGQNTLVVGSVSQFRADQESKATGEFTRIESNEKSSIAVVDMTAAYPDVKEGSRGILFTEDRSMIVLQDEMILQSAEQVRWSAHTGGKITVGENGRTATIKIGSDMLYCEIVCDDPSFVFSVGEAVSFDENYERNKKEKSVSGISKLMIRSDNNVERYKLAVVFKPLTAGEDAPTVGTSYSWSDMADWKLQQ